MKKNLSWKAFLIDAYLSVKKPKSIFSETSDLSFNRIVKGFEKETIPNQSRISSSSGLATLISRIRQNRTLP